MHIARPAIERFLPKLRVVESGCWDWQAGRDRHGYGTFYVAGARSIIRAHRFAYEYWIGQIPQHLELDHLCRNRICVNPDHLEPVTQRENALRGVGWAGQNARKTHCPQGHPYDEENTRHYQYGLGRWGRRCKACEKRWSANNYYEKKRLREATL